MNSPAHPGAPAPRPSSFAPLHERVYRDIWLASLVSNIGSLIQSVGAAWLMTSIATSADTVALVQASTALPVMLFSLFSGAIADSFDRRGVMLIAQVFMLSVSVALAVTTWLGLITPALLLAFTFLLGCGTALNNPSWQASVGDMVPRSQLPAAVALNSLNFNLTRSVGPAIGGLIVAAAGPAMAFAVNAVSYLAPLAAIARWKPEPPLNPLPREALGPAMRAGLRYVALSPNIERVLVRGFVFGFASIAILALLPIVTREELGGSSLTYGIMLGCFGIGAIGGALSSGALRERLTAETIVRAAFLGFAFCGLVTSQSHSAILTGASLLVAGASWVLALSLFNVTVQLSTPRWVVGRALALYQTATFGGMAIGSWVWGLLAEANGVQASLLVAVAAMAAGALMGLFLALPARTALKLDPLNRWKEPSVALGLNPESGPIVINIRYRIREGDTLAFLEAMTERRRIRHRDGARQWALMRDVEHPDLWIESYHTSTWVDYVRHNQRATLEDAVVGERIRALHSDPEPPKVERLIERPTNWYSLLLSPRGVIDPF